MKIEFEMIDLGLMKYFLGIEIEQSTQGIFVCHQKYDTYIMKIFRRDKYKLAKTHIALGTKLSKQDEGSTIDSNLYKRLIGSLMYLTATRPDTMFARNLFPYLWNPPRILIGKLEKESLGMLQGHLTMVCGAKILNIIHL